MTSERTQIEAVFGRTLLPMARRWRAEADRTLSGLDVSHASGWVLLHVGRLGDAASQSDLAVEADMSGPSLVRLLDRLEADGLILRRTDEEDRRVNRVHLTDAGTALVGKIEDSLRIVRREMLDGIAEEDLNIATQVMVRIARRLAHSGGRG